MTNLYLNLNYKNGIIASLTTFLLVMSSNLFAQVPSIASFSPTSGNTGSPIIITGTNFGSTIGTNTVYFGTVKATITAASTTSLTVIVPKGATFSPVSVTTNSKIAYSSKPFITTYLKGNISGYSYKRDFETGATKDNISAKNTTLADLDLDGKLDLITNNFHGKTLSIFKNNSDFSGEFNNLSLSARTDYATEINPSNVSVADLDGDGKLDLVIPNFGDASISILKNNSTSGAISFGAAQKIYTDSSPRIASIVDIDGDGKLDIAVVNEHASSISILRNTTSGTSISFATKVDVYTYSSNPRDLRFADFDGDGKTDFVTSDFGSGSITLFRNTSTTGSISLSYSTSIYTGGSPRSSTIGDFDGDGKIDVAVANYSSSSVHIYKNQSTSGSISFNSGSTISNIANAYGITAGDIDGDGKVDLAVAHNTTTGGFTVLKNASTTGAISFNSQAYYNASEGTSFVTIGDLDGDSSPELIASNYFVNVVSILSQGATTLPLSLLRFDGNIENDIVKLKWHTANELNISHFVVEHSLNTTFDSIGVMLPGKENYTLNTSKILGGNNYYRLKIVNLDGTISYSNILDLYLGLEETSTALLIYPNPSSTTVTVKYPNPDKQAEISLFNTSGKGVIKIHALETQTTFDISNLPTGVYVVQWTNGKKKLTQKLIKE